MAEQADIPATARTEEWRASQLLHRPVVHALRVEHIGEVADIAFDPESSELAGLLIGPPGPDGSVLDVVRRAVGRDFGLTFVPAGQILALSGDVVMVEAGRAHASRGACLAGSGRATHWPQLRKVQGFAVVTIHGRRLGRLVDLILDASGRRVTGYLINPAAPAQRPSQPASRPLLTAKRTPTTSSDGRKPDTRAGEAQAAIPASATDLLVVRASSHVRVGRDLIAVGVPPGAQWSVQDTPTARIADGRPPTWPAHPGRSLADPDGPTRSDWRRADDMRYPPDAPTEALQ